MFLLNKSINSLLLKRDTCLSPKRMDYLMNISRKHKYVYFETPKVACSTIKLTLQSIEGKTLSDSKDLHVKEKSSLLSPFGLSPLEFTKCLRSNDYFRFSFVRNPITRVLAAYLNKIDHPFQRNHKRIYLKYVKQFGVNEFRHISFNDFLFEINAMPRKELNSHWCPQSLLLSIDNINYNFIGKFENFDQDLNELLRLLGGRCNKNFTQHKKVVRKHATNASDKTSHFVNDQSLKYISSIYQDDFHVFNYECATQ